MDALKAGKTVVVDRYAHSGVCFSSGACTHFSGRRGGAATAPACCRAHSHACAPAVRPVSPPRSFARARACTRPLCPAAKTGLGFEWCKSADEGLPQPDLILFMDLSVEAASQRGGFGGERRVARAGRGRQWPGRRLPCVQGWVARVRALPSLDAV